MIETGLALLGDVFALGAVACSLAVLVAALRPRALVQVGPCCLSLPLALSLSHTHSLNLSLSLSFSHFLSLYLSLARLRSLALSGWLF